MAAIDITQIAITVGPAAVTGLVGYHGARLQAENTRRQVEADNERLRAEHSETHLRSRQQTYHGLLDCVNKFHLMALGAQPATDGDFAAWMQEFNHLLNAVRLFGTDDVRAAGDGLNDVFARLGAHLDVTANGNPFDEQLDEAYRSLMDEFIPARAAVIDAMRSDVAPAPGAQRP